MNEKKTPDTPLLPKSAEPDRITPDSIDESYMRRALQLATYGSGRVSPNPMVGAVITARGRIIGEGWHRIYGGPHAEVNAFESVQPADRTLLPEATMYVTLEPCSHYGKTPPCALRIIKEGIHRVVTGAADPNPLVSGRGIKMIRENGIEVTEGVLREECEQLNRRFITAQIRRRPWIQLKWARSADGFIATTDEHGNSSPVKLSNSLTEVLMHRERALADAIMAGTNTVISDNPRLNLRHWPGTDPRIISFKSDRISPESKIFLADPILLSPHTSLRDAMHRLFEDFGTTSVMVEGGAKLLTSFIEEGLFDEIREEISSSKFIHGLPAPHLPSGLRLIEESRFRGNTIKVWRR